MTTSDTQKPAPMTATQVNRIALKKRIEQARTSEACNEATLRRTLSQLADEAQELLDSTADSKPVEQVYVIFDGPPSHDAGRFVETHTEDDRGCGFAPNTSPDDQHPQWEQRTDGLWRLGPFLATGRVTA